MNVTYYQQFLEYSSQIKNLGKFLYIVNPYETTFEFLAEVPDYQQQIWIPFFILIILEQLILFIRKKSSFRLNDHITSLSHWILQESGRIFFLGAEYYVYIHIYNEYRIWSLPWNSLWTWYITVIGVDFCYYWVHRANHEIHLLWSQHQVHHSSEEFNLVVGLRQSIMQQWCSFMFYLPLALFIPPSHFITHHQLNLIYQLWLHTTLFNHLGPLEYIFNTPRHHRVHHGCNIYCLDKNYGGVFIIWDRMFGTFAEEQIKEEIIYGLVVSPQTFNPIYLQVFYTKMMIEKCCNMRTITDKLAAIWKGPSWIPGLPRLGLDKYKIHVTSRIKYNPSIPKWQYFYIILHFCIILHQHFNIYNNEDCKLLIMNNILSLTTIGLLFDRSSYASILELSRCILHILCTVNLDLVFYIHLLSCFIWIVHIIYEMRQLRY
ncbi:alkylglycerol monooxygenase-like [Chelonus insularis]|uniref:alkylglycerol monooxygenase-like n=1 Tax=Chelonus insularis TaxID=460826 RepID=UPI00158C2BCA|nr:alkylglycerol monooxygenase-like [Chelonus insularis]